MPPFLLRRNGRYYLRLTIPPDLRRWFDGKREIRKALPTTNNDLAKSLVRGHLYKAEKLFAAIRREMMDDAQIKSWFRST